MKNDFATKIFFEIRGCVNSEQIGLATTFSMLQDLTNIEEQPKSLTGANDTK